MHTSTHMTEAIIAIFFALYYNLNLEYPKQSSCTMEMVQQYFLKIHPNRGSKSGRQSSKFKIIGLINKLRD